ncbi:MAG: hypothetical protein K9M96_15805 [Deltaproteobacteria bacterium]|mgnify:FL=1|nr:hypothetical protein [Deltaproteobacteria bacterium]
MNTYEENLQYEEKMDRISEELEEMVLDTMIAVLKKIRERNFDFSRLPNQTQSEPFPF